LPPFTVEAVELIKSSIKNDLIVNYLVTLLCYATNSPWKRYRIYPLLAARYSKLRLNIAYLSVWDTFAY